MIKANADCTHRHNHRGPSKRPQAAQNSSDLARPPTGPDLNSPVMKIGEVAQRFNLSLTTIRRATERGTLSCFTLPSGHRRFREQDVLSWLGVEQEEVCVSGGIPIAAVIRVSSDNQARPNGGADKSSLQHQEDRVREFIEERWDSANVIWYRSVGSGMNFDRAEFLSLVSDILDGKFRGGFVVTTDVTRICRFGIRLFEFLCQRGGCKVIYTLNDGEAKSLNETLTDEILAILTHYTARASGQKNKLINEVRMSEDQLRDAYLWYKQGFSYKAIEKRFSDEGRGTNEQGKPITKTVIVKRLEENWEMLETMYASEIPPNTFQQFCATYVVSDSKGLLERKALVDAYHAWAKAEGIPAISAPKISSFTETWNKVRAKRNATYFKGLKLTYPDSQVSH